MKFLRNLFIAVAVVAVILVAVGFFLPKSVHMERSTTINAPIDEVFQQVNTFKNYNSWSPFFERDPDAQYQFSGPESGVGAKMAWESDKPKVGTGSQEIIESDYPVLVKSKLLFGEATEPSFTAFKLEELSSEETKVTWSFAADFGNNIVGRYFGLFMDDMLGPDYEKGLASLKNQIE